MLSPLYQSIFSDFFVTLSPSVALTGIIFIFSNSSSFANSFTSLTILLNFSSLYFAKSILFTAKIKCRIPTIEQILACLLVCTSTPFVTSRSKIATSAKEAPTAIFRVYSSCPGVSATIKLRLFVVKYRYATSIVIPCSLSAINPSKSSE